MKKRVGRVEAIIIMKAARELRERQKSLAQVIPEVMAAPAPVIEPVPSKKSFLTRVFDFFKNRGS